MDKKNEQEKNGRIIGKVTDIEREQILHFYEARAERYQEKNPYAVTMLQDNNPQLVKERNQKETEKLLPLLSLDGKSRVLDVACGIGRWYDAIDTDIEEYCGVDLCEGLIQIAKERHKEDNVDFLTGAATELCQVLEQNGKGKYNRALVIGGLMYFNDEDICDVLNQICRVTDKDSILCMREPIGISDRLTLRDFYSDELQHSYNAIYRTREELMKFFASTLLVSGFCVEKEGWLFEDDLNNRKETAQYYFVFRRKGEGRTVKSHLLTYE